MRPSSFRCSATLSRRTATCSSVSVRVPTAPFPISSSHHYAGWGPGSLPTGRPSTGSRPWVITESETAEGTPLRFTQSGEGVYAHVMGMPSGRRLTLRDRSVAGPASPSRGIARRPTRVVERGRGVDGDDARAVAAPAVTVLDLGKDVRTRLGPRGHRGSAESGQNELGLSDPGRPGGRSDHARRFRSRRPCGRHATGGTLPRCSPRGLRVRSWFSTRPSSSPEPAREG